MSKTWRAIVMVCGLMLTSAASAVEWQTLSADEQRLLKPYEGQWGSFSSERQERMQRGAQR